MGNNESVINQIIKTTMKVLSLLICITLLFASVSGFSSSSSFVCGDSKITSSCPRSSNLQMFFGAAKDDGSPGDYLCKDCGYVFTKGPAAWSKLSDKSYKCPPCGSPKFRFKKVAKASASGKVEVKKGWFS